MTLIGLIILWPRGDIEAGGELDPSDLFGDRLEAVISGNQTAPCSYDVLIDCAQVSFQVIDKEGARTDSTWEMPLGSSTGHFDEGDEIYVNAAQATDGTVTYSFSDFQRETPLLLLAGIFVVAVLLLARWKGLGAIGGLVASLLVLIVFMLPSLLRGNNAVAVALVGSSVIAFIALYLAHGINISTTVALLSTFVSLCLIGLLSWIFVAASNFTGFTEDSSFALSALGVQVDARGLLLAGIVIGSLGVLDDVTVTQVSAVWELRQLQPSATRGEIYRAAVNIGRDHISSTVNTLFLTYAGAALPLMLLFAVAGQSVGAVSTSEVVATEIVRALVGSIGLVASVPISTWLAARVLTVRPAPD
ncbi:MAG: YibE/F family protein [Ilumatobacteraceae bacterium]